jgi:UDP-glucose 4-epimerase
MKIAVTGGSGFIGAYLIDVLHRRGHQVVNIDRNAPPPLNAETVIADVCSPDEMAAALKDTQAVYHLAGLVEGTANRNPIESYRVQLQGTLAVLQACIAQGVKWFGLASTFLVYQGAVGNGQVDEHTAIDPAKLGPFAAAKIASECMVRDIASRHGIDYAIFRFGSAYGSGPSSNVIGDFLRAMTQQEPLRIWGKGQRQNQYTFVADIAEGAALALNIATGVVNLVSPETTTTSEIAEHLREKYGAHVEYLLDKPERGQMTYMASNKARELLNWQTVPVTQGIALTIERMNASSQ